jgi:3-oxoacyl-[acyl-carrier-protein] synthase II
MGFIAFKRGLIVVHDVVVTGVGAVAGLDADAASIFARLAQGGSMVRDNLRYRDLGFRSSAMASVSEAAWSGVNKALGAVPEGWGLATRLGVHAGRQALASAGLRGLGKAVVRAGVFVGNNRTAFSDEDLLQMARCFDRRSGVLDLDALIQVPGLGRATHDQRHQDTALLALAAETGWQHNLATHGDACAAGAMAIGAAFRRIRAGELDVALAGAAESMANFVSLAALTVGGVLAADGLWPAEQTSRPFDKDRCGFVLGEGAAFLMLEAADHARARGARVLAKVRGFAMRLDPQGAAASPAHGNGYARCMTAALADAAFVPSDVDHVNAHGVSMQTNDANEALAIKQVFGSRVDQVAVTANKSAMGHSLAGSGAMQAVLSVLSLHRQTLLPTLNFHQPDADTDGLDIVTQARHQQLRAVLSNSFGFGGENCSLVLEAA